MAFSTIWLLALCSYACPQPEMRQLPSQLGPIPHLAFDSASYRPTEEERREIDALITQLTEIAEPDYGMAPWMSGQQFAPVPSSQQFGAGIIMVDHGLQTSDTITRLVTLGPKAIPALVAALDDATPSKLVMEHGGVSGGMWYGREIITNDAQPREQRVMKAHPDVFPPGRDLGGSIEDHIDKHAITRGDLCFLVIGQIVNRGYQPTRYQPTACRVINSPTHDPELAAIVREIWRSDDPARTLFESLVADLYTRGRAAHFQAGAAMRLLFYFPEESRDLIVGRIDDFDVRLLLVTDNDWAAWREQQKANGEVRADKFIKAVAFSDDPAITAAILRVIERTDDPSVLSECLSEAVAAADPDLVLRRMTDIVATPPPTEQGPFGGKYHTLRAAATLFPDASRPLFELYLEHETLPCRRAVVHALANPEAPVPWATEFLAPLLDDRTDTGWAYGPDYDRKSIRVCDEAAATLTFHVEGATFEREGETSNLDRQIENIRRRIAGEEVAEPVVAIALPFDFDALPALSPIASFELDDRIGCVYDFSDERTLFVGMGYRANGWAYDTATIDVATGTVTERVKIDEWNGGVSILRPIVGTRALCYHGEDGGHIVVRDLRTGDELSRIETPFHDGIGLDDQWQVRDLGDIYVSGDGRWIVAITPNGALHTISVETGEHRQVWKREGEAEIGFLHGSLVPVSGTNRFIVEFFGEDDPLRVWDQDTKKIETITKVPDGAWGSAWGKYAYNNLNSQLEFWDLEVRKPLDLLLPEGIAVHDLLCDGDQSVLLLATVEGPVYVIDLETIRPIARLKTPHADGRVALSLASDDRLLVWTCDLTNYDRNTGERSNRRTLLAVFDVAAYTR